MEPFVSFFLLGLACNSLIEPVEPQWEVTCEAVDCPNASTVEEVGEDIACVWECAVIGGEDRGPPEREPEAVRLSLVFPFDGSCYTGPRAVISVRQPECNFEEEEE